MLLLMLPLLPPLLDTKAELQDVLAATQQTQEQVDQMKGCGRVMALITIHRRAQHTAAGGAPPRWLSPCCLRAATQRSPPSHAHATSACCRGSHLEYSTNATDTLTLWIQELQAASTAAI
jgi:hypothetical protein